MTDENEVAEILIPSEALAKLKEARTLVPGFPDQMYRLFDFLAKRVEGRKLVPLGFVMAVELAIQDVKDGKDGFTGEPITLFHGMPGIGMKMMLMSFRKCVIDRLGVFFGPELEVHVLNAFKDVE